MNRRFHYEALLLDTGKSFNISFAYEQNDFEHRKELWRSMECFAANNNKARIVLGDFNAVLHAEDKIGGNKSNLT